MKVSTVIKILCVILSAYSISCNPEFSEEPIQLADSSQVGNERKNVSFELITNRDSTYGYDIFLDGKIYIHQPIIPHYSGWQGFQSPEAASRMARFLVKRLKQNYPHFILTKQLADSLLARTDSIKAVRQSNDVASHLKLDKHELFPGYAEKSETNQYPLPKLPDPPIKVSWRALGRAPFGERSITSSFSIGDWVYIGAGEHNDQITNDFWAYDTRTDAWTCVALIPESGRLSCISFVINGKGYLGLGALKSMTTFGFRNDFYEYDPVSNSWTPKANFPGPPRIDAAYFVINGKGYAGLGFSGTHEKDFYEFDPVKNSWKRIKDFKGGPISAASGISVFGKGFVTCGDSPSENKRFLYEYLPEKDSWEQREDFPGKARYYSNGNGIDSNLFMAGGGRATAGAVNYRDYYLYNTQTGKWSGLPDYLIGPEGISRSGGGNVNGHIYAGTGYNGLFQDEWNVFEYYYTTRKDTGLYNEGVCYPMKYDGSWELYQECTGGNCYAGMAIKTTEKLGDLCYSSWIDAGNEAFREVKVQNRRVLLLPKTFQVRTEKIPAKPYALRLFFSRESFEKIAKAWKDSAGTELKASQIRILLSDVKTSSQAAISDLTGISKSLLITPILYGYGYQQETWVAELPVSSNYSSSRMAVIID